MLRAQRLSHIIQAVNQYQMITIEELMEVVGTSKATIRRDIAELSASGMVEKIRGGVSAVGKNSTVEPSISIKSVLHIEEKRRIARYARKYIENGDRILLDSGTTILELAKLLVGNSHITAVTYDLSTAVEVAKYTNIDLMMIGGMLRKNFYTTYGNFAEYMLNNLHVNKAFLGVDALSPDQGIMSYTTDDVTIKRLILDAANETIILCDHSKFESSALINIAGLNHIDRIITDQGADEKTVYSLREMGIEVEVV